MRKMRAVLGSLVGAGVFLALVGLSGCSQEGTAPTPNPNPGARRDELQKSLQPGLPGKKAPVSKRG